MVYTKRLSHVGFNALIMTSRFLAYTTYLPHFAGEFDISINFFEILGISIKSKNHSG